MDSSPILWQWACFSSAMFSVTISWYATLEDARRQQNILGAQSKVPADLVTDDSAQHGNLVILFSTLRKKYCVIPRVSLQYALTMDLGFLEMADQNTARPFIDFDSDVLCNIDQIQQTLEKYCRDVYNLPVRFAWKYSTNNDGSCRRWHCILSGIFFAGCWKEECLKMASMLATNLPATTKIDHALYKTNSSLRLAGQSKIRAKPYTAYEPRVHKIYRCHKLDDVFITPQGDASIYIPITEMASRSTATAQRVTLPYSYAGLEIPPEFRVDRNVSVKDGVMFVRLIRIASSYCKVCGKIHDRENAYLIISALSTTFRCFRYPSSLNKSW